MLRLEDISGRKKYYEAIKFLIKASKIIVSKKLNSQRTFHIKGLEGKLIAISSGDIIYPTTQNDIKIISSFLILLEDRRFYSHCGIDIRSIFRALIYNLISRKIVQGGSTITQQLIRNTFITSHHSLLRKILEIILALKIEKYYSKEEILYLYCQYVYLGGGIRGFSTASKIIYRCPLSALNNKQICGLLGLLRSPSITYPQTFYKKYIDRQNLISQFLLKDSFPTSKKEIKPHAKETVNPIKLANLRNPRFTHIINHQLRKEFKTIPSDISKVEITVNPHTQKILDDVLREVSCYKNVSQVAAIILDNKQGNVIAESSWQKNKESEFSPSFHGNIQPGSTFKTFALLTALEQGLELDYKIESRYFQSTFIKSKKNIPWLVRNYGEIYRGELTLKEAFAYSDNTAFARLTELLDFDKLIQTYKRFGLYKEGKISHSVVLGGITNGISLLQLASSYRTIARNGIFTPPRFIKSIQFTNGDFFWLRVRSEITSRFPASDTPYIKGVVHSEITGYSQYASTH